jgi:hypothetical protein
MSVPADQAERPAIELPLHGDLAFGALMDALAPDPTDAGKEAATGPSQAQQEMLEQQAAMLHMLQELLLNQLTKEYLLDVPPGGGGDALGRTTCTNSARRRPEPL